MITLQIEDPLLEAFWHFYKNGNNFTIKQIIAKSQRPKMTVVNRIHKWAEENVVEKIGDAEKTDNHGRPEKLYRINIDRFQKAVGRVVE